MKLTYLMVLNALVVNYSSAFFHVLFAPIILYFQTFSWKLRVVRLYVTCRVQ